MQQHISLRHYRIRRTPILPMMRGSLRRHRWYAALGNARPTRVARSHAASYRAINHRRRTLYDLADKDRQRGTTLYQHGARFHSVNDPIEAEVLRIRCELYCALAAGADAEQAFRAHYARAAAACEAFNAKQEAAMRKSWHPTDTGHFSMDEAWNRLRHAIKMYQKILQEA